MNKQEAIEKIKNIGTLKINDTVSHQQIYMVDKNKVLGIISQIHEPKKPVVPQFVAEYIEYCKHEKFYALHGAYANMDDKLKCWRFKGNNSELFAKAWLYGYEVKKEKLYTVEIPNPNESDSGHIVLHKDEHNKVYIDWHYEDDWKLLKSLKLTEAEIKEDFEWAWQFAKEVEE
ncbi:DUF1642 domain-containing protein [Streptococcus infantarius]|uniref:DUF1642 domain-containing protein n=1 Tax=Streptococcus infantarius TaxID=102684 RepID=UPI003D12F5F5